MWGFTTNIYLKGNYTEELPVSIRPSLRSCWEFKDNATVHHLVNHVTSWKKLQHASSNNYATRDTTRRKKDLKKVEGGAEMQK